MENGLNAIGIELIVDDLDRAVELFVDVMGGSLLSREPSGMVVGEVAIIDAGSIVISLLAPAPSGPGTVLAERTPRLSQLIFGSSEPERTLGTFDRAVAAGLAVSNLQDGRFHVTPESAAGALGQPVAIVTVSVPEP
ncbi:MAG: hypothetical protein JWM34_2637 [Ilumatobacteraceae bacterium]|nr:hypothetical protein [Ilumatobacteraceae bacterium]